MTERRGLAAGRYLLENEPIGSGGMGTVWRAHDQKLQRQVAIKALHVPDGLSAEEQAGLRARAIREARAVARLDHPGIVAVYDVLEEDGQPWIVMRLVDGCSLDQEVKANGPLDPRRAAEVGAQLLEALAAAHEEGVLHLDVKPQNVLLDDRGRVALTDFGVASVADAARTLTQTGSLVGTVGYVSPERLAGAPPSPASDLWSLGATLYFAVEGRHAYVTDSLGATVAAVMVRNPDPMTRAGSLAPVISGLLSRDVESRADTATARAQLHAVATGEPDSAGQTVPLGGHAPTRALPTETLRRSTETTPTTDRRWVRRTIVAAVAAVLLGAVVAVPLLTSPGHGNNARQSGVTGSPVGSSTAPRPTVSLTPSPSPSPIDSVRYTAVPNICTKLPGQVTKIIPKIDSGSEGEATGSYDGLVESHECEWLTAGYWSEQPWAASVSVDLFRFSESTGASTAFEDERTDFYKDALRIPDFGDELCLSNPTGDDYGYAHVMFRVDNLLVQVSYEMQTHGSPAPAAAKPRGMSLARYVYGLVEAAA